MRKVIVISVVLVAALAGVMVFRRGGASPAETSVAPGSAGPAAVAGSRIGQRPPMTVETAPTRRETVSEQILVVGNLIGEATVEVVPKVSGRLQDVLVKLGDRVSRGQTVARVEDREIREQVRQAEASFQVAQATVRQREADLKFALTSLERSRSLFARQLVAKQALDDAEARHDAAEAQLDLSRAQLQQTQSRLEELRITLANTSIESPVDGYVGRRNLDPGAYASPNSPVMSVVDLKNVRMVANLIEKDLKRVSAGTPATVEVDAYPGERFSGRVARVAPIFDPATRTATMEIEVPNPTLRLKPGMYARVVLTVSTRTNALVIPRNALVDVEGTRGVFVPADDRAQFRPVKTGIQDENRVEVTQGLDEGAHVITTGALALKHGDVIVLAGRRPSGGPGGAAQQRPGAGPDGGRRPRS